MHRLTGVILDVDGTLADTEEVHRQAFNAAFAELQLPWEWTRALYAQLLSISGGRARMREYARSLGEDHGTARGREPDWAALHQRKTEIYQALLARGTLGLRPGVRRLIDEVRSAGLLLGIATSTARANVVQLLDAQLPAGWQKWFDAIVTCDDVSEMKPSAAVYVEALRRMRAPAADCVAVEDTMNGLRAARGAGLRTLITTHCYTQQCWFPGASLVVDGLGEPGLPCTVLSSSIGPIERVDVAVLRRMVEAGPVTQFRFHTPAAYAAAV